MREVAASRVLGAGVRLVALLIAALAACEPADPQPISPAALAGDNTCITCHQAMQSFRETAHHRTSALPTQHSIDGSFQRGENVLRTSNPYLHYRMEAREDGFYQTAVLGETPDTTRISERIGVVIGSGRKGQSYLYRRDDRLFMLPVSHWTELDDWVTSPGYRGGVVQFNSPVNPRCLECHATYAQSVPSLDATNRYDTLVLGISCETCHGPGREHVERQSIVLGGFRAQAIINPADLPRERQIDLCGLCHGGIGEPLAPAFTYTPGEPLEKYLRQRPTSVGEAVDVHGNQVALLKMSPCYQNSRMTCSTCHDVHQTQRDIAKLSDTCLTCHPPEMSGLLPPHGDQLTGQCVSCHMPELPTRSIIVSHEGQSLRPRVRTHWIRVYSPAERAAEARERSAISASEIDDRQGERGAHGYDH